MTTRRPPWWLIALLVLMAFAFQGTRAIWEPDEGRYTAVGLNMLESGDWLVPTLDGEHAHLTKPPITYWAIAAGVGLLGHNEWGARPPGALAFVATVLVVSRLGCRPRDSVLDGGPRFRPLCRRRFHQSGRESFVERRALADPSRSRLVAAPGRGERGRQRDDRHRDRHH